MRYFSLGQQRVLLLLILLILGLLYFRFYHSPAHSPPEELGPEFVIEITGEVSHPGIYFFQSPPSLQEAILQAGGLKEGSLSDPVSSETLETGTLLTVLKTSPHEVKILWGRMEAQKSLVLAIPLDLNRVSAEDLCLIPGIGESLAREILLYREKRKRFHTVEELKQVKGIGEKKYESVRHFFTVRQ